MYDNMNVVIQVFSDSPIQFIQMFVVHFNRSNPQEGSANGITGPIDFDRDFKTRRNFHMEFIMLDKSVFKKTAEWDARRGLVVTRSDKELQSQKSAAIQRKAFRVATRLAMPYLREVESGDKTLEGNDRYEGFIKDLMDDIAKLNNFSYEFVREPNDHLGKYHHQSGRWDGIIGN